MSTAAVNGYEGGTGQLTYLEGADGELFVKLYNDTGSAITNGYVFKIDYTDDADSKGFYPTPATPATDANRLTQIVVANNRPRAMDTIEDATWGWFQLRGYCPKVISNVGGSGVRDEYFIKAVDAVTTAADDATSISTKSFGIAKSASGATSLAPFTAVLFGVRVVV